jgi:peptidoglycan/xylan/chitin deacetylase (PgdA/CDA1 family)
MAAGALAALVHFAPGSVAWRRARCRLLPRLSGVGAPGHVALTFDDGPDPASTPWILDTLDQLGWRATFFCLGIQVDRAPGLTRELVSRGHELGVHGYRHTSHLRRPAPWAIRDVLAARDRIAAVAGVEPRWFRPPYGAVSASSLAASRASGMQLVLWTSWGLDWEESATPESVVANVNRTWVPGATVLLHDSDVTSAPGSWRSTVSALPRLAAHWQQQGLTVGPLGEHCIP